MDRFNQEDAAGLGTLVSPRQREAEQKQHRFSRYDVVLWDSDAHSYEYVERMLRELFGHTPERCHQLAETVDTEGRVTVLTTNKEHAELKRDQIMAYGKDRIAGCKGSMWSTIEEVEG
ncbi:MAG: ATP-dependent Clp protease adaptor ClpS [Planctomycetia bacterium]|nr:MAG: ATP-dependent Clp protease adaptor ClpS [Planctomycetia bacterium]